MARWIILSLKKNLHIVPRPLFLTFFFFIVELKRIHNGEKRKDGIENYMNSWADES